jgi:hypothetical protein
MLKRRALLIATVLLCDAPLAQNAHPLTWRAGDTWSYQTEDLWRKDSIGSDTLTVVSRTEASAILRTESGTVSFEETVASDGRHDRPRVGVVGAYSHMPVRFPLSVGDKWKSSGLYQGNQGDIRKREYNCHAKREEQIAIALGRYETIVIECSGNWTAPQGFGARYELKLWYAPSVRWLVQAEERSWRPSTGSPGIDTQTRSVLTKLALKE